MIGLKSIFGGPLFDTSCVKEEKLVLMVQSTNFVNSWFYDWSEGGNSSNLEKQETFSILIK